MLRTGEEECDEPHAKIGNKFETVKQIGRKSRPESL